MHRLSNYGPSLIVLATLLLLLVAGPVAVRQLTWHQTHTRVQLASERLDENPVLERLNDAYRDLASFVEPSVVHISTERAIQDRLGNTQTLTSSGSGWIYDDEGHVVTNFHVVQEADRIEVQMFDGEIHPAEMTGFDQFTDIALIRIDTGRVHAAARAGPGERVQQGDMVFAFGSPFDFRFSMSSGVVSGMGRSVGVIRDSLGRTGYENFIQVDAAVNPGNSGGPLTDIHGRVIGMNTAIATAGRRGSFEEGQFAGIGLAIPIDMIEPVVDQLITTRVVQKGFLGVVVEDVTPALAQQLQAMGFRGTGVRIINVHDPGPARDAGVRRDDVITHVNGNPVGSQAQLRSAISSMLPGETSRLSIWRSDADPGMRSLELPVVLTRLDGRSVAGVLPSDQPRDMLEPFGIASMSDSTRERAERDGVPYVSGVVIEAIVPRSQIDGLVPPGSLLVEVMGDPVVDIDDLFTQLKSVDLGQGNDVRVAFLIGGHRRPVILKMP